MPLPHVRRVAFVLLAAACAGSGGRRVGPAHPDGIDAASAQRAWWRAFVLADTAHLRAHSTDDHALTLSSGRAFDRDGMLAESASHQNGARLTVEWSDERARSLGSDAAVVTSRVTEREGAAAESYRYVTVLRRQGADWRVAAAQSTREVAFTPRVGVAVAGALGDYAGAYRTPRGGMLRVVVRDSALGLVEPSGLEVRLEPVGPALFEFTVLSPSNGVVRVAFARDGSGRVTSFSRLAPSTVSTFPRAP